MTQINFDQAQNIALDKIGSDCAIIAEYIIEKPYGWYFNFQSRKYIETGDFREMLVGSGGFIVEKETGNVVKFGSAYPLEKNFEIYEKGLIGKTEFIIKEVRGINLAVRLLLKLRMSYIEPEFAYGVEWKIPKEFNEKQIKAALSNLPYTYRNQKFYFRSDVFEQIDNSNCLVYELRNK